jgi:TetR/AcrR family transcriptional repressor of nem operon
LFERADKLSEDPLQQMLIFLKLLAEAMENLSDVHPGCLVATFTSANQQLNDEVKSVTANCTLSTMIEGGIIMSRTLSEQRLLVQQILQYRNYLRLIYGNISQ